MFMYKERLWQMPLETSSAIIGLWEISVDVAFSKWAAKLKLLPSPNPTPPNPTPPSLSVEISVSEGKKEQEASNSDIVKEIDINNT